MKMVWKFFNKSYKKKTQQNIKLDHEQHQQFMTFWKELYQDQRKQNDMANIKYEIDLNYNIPETEGPTFEEINEIL